MRIEDRMSMWAAKRPRDEVSELLLEGAQEIADLRRHREEDGDEMAILRADNSRRANLEQGLRDGIVRLSANGDFPESDNAANADNTPAANATPTEGSVQDGCTLTDAEREAVHQAAIRVEALCQRGSKHMAATLRSLLERTK